MRDGNLPANIYDRVEQNDTVYRVIIACNLIQSPYINNSIYYREVLCSHCLTITRTSVYL
jgi:hypothetical protein